MGENEHRQRLEATITSNVCLNRSEEDILKKAESGGIQELSQIKKGVQYLS